MLRKLLTAGLGMALLGTGLAAAVVLPASPAGATTPPDFTICPSVGQDTGGCQTVVVINPSGPPTIYNNTGPNSGPFDGQEDSLVGVQNDSGQTIPSLPLSGPSIFNLDNDGLCTFIDCSTWSAPTTYEGPNTSFTITDVSDGAVNFTGGLPDQGTAYFSLEGVVTSSSLVVDLPIHATPVTATTTQGFSGPVANFTDTGSGETAGGYTATINWGDGSGTDNGTVTGTAPNFTVSGTHDYSTTSTTGAVTVMVTIVDTTTPSNQATVNSSFTVNPECTSGTACTTSASQNGVQQDQVTTSNGGNVSVSEGTDASLACGGTSQADPLTTTLTSSGATGSAPKVVTTTLDPSVVGSKPASVFHICYSGGSGFTDLHGNSVPAGGTGLLPFCVNLSGVGPRNNPPPCLISAKLVSGSVVLVFYAPAGDPHYGSATDQPPTITSISPTSGSHLGSTLVTIKGTNFTLLQRVLFGTSVGLSIKVLSVTSITVKTPAHAAGTVDIRVQTAGGVSAIVTADKFKFT
jgi:hypothetical protein